MSGSPARGDPSSRSSDLQRDLWILVVAGHPHRPTHLFQDPAESLADPALRQLFLHYAPAHDLDAGGPRIDDLARRTAEAIRERHGPDEPPELDAASGIPALVQSTVSASSPEWQRLDTLIRAPLRA